MHSKNVSLDNSFALLEDAIALADIAVASRDPARIVPMIVNGLQGVLTADPALPSWLLATTPDTYLRHELYRSGRHDYQIVAISWAPGQDSGVHDHGDAWGVEAVVRGALEVVDYRIVDRRDALTTLQAAPPRALRAGQAMGLLPPHDLHACRNASAHDGAVSLHIYGTALEHVCRYVQVAAGDWRAQRTLLTVA